MKPQHKQTKNILFIWLWAVWYVLIKAINQSYRKSNIKVNFFVLSRNHEFEGDLAWSDIKYTTIIAEDFKKFLSKKSKFDHKIDLAINCVSPDFNIDLLNRCVINKSAYLDLASNIWLSEIKKLYFEQDKYDAIFKKNNIWWIYNAGISPGISELLISYIIRKYNINPTSIQIYLKENFDSVIPLWSRSPSVAITEMLTEPIYIKDKKINHGEIFSPQNRCIWKKRTHYYRVTQEELISIKKYYPTVRDLGMFVSWSEIEKVKFLYDIWLLSDEKVWKNSLLEILKSKMPRSATPKQIIKANKNKLIDDVWFWRDIKIIWDKEQTHVISLDFDMKWYNKVQKSIYKWATSISYPTWLWASIFANMLLDKEKIGIYDCLQSSYDLEMDQIKNIINFFKHNHIKIKIK